MREALRIMSVMVCVSYFQGSPSAVGQVITKARAAVETVDETSEKKFEGQLSDWLGEIVLASGNYDVVPRKEAHYLMLGTLKRAEALIIRQEPAVEVQFELWVTELDPKTLEPALIPEINVNRSISQTIFFLPVGEAIKKVMREAFEVIRGGLFHEKGTNLHYFHNRFKPGYPHRTRG